MTTTNFSTFLPDYFKKNAMDIEQLKADAVYSEDQNRLFDLTIIITEEISALHKEVHLPNLRKTTFSI
jgi:predicted nucleotidyltransferase